VLINRRGLLAGLAITAAAPALSFQPATWPAPARELMVRITALATDRAVILYDQLGCGRSDRPAGRGWWTVPHFVSEVDAVRQALGLSRLHLLGHSWGGTVALEYTARRPAGLLSTVLASPLVSTRAWIADADALRRQLPAAVQQTLVACDARPAPACEAATHAFYGAFNGREPASPAAIAYARSVGGRGSNGDMYRAMWGTSEFSSTGSLRDYDGEPLLTRLNGDCTLFLGGQYDEARPSTLAGFAARVAGAEFATVPGAAHGLFGDRPTETLGILSGWLERHDG
jgi:proline-specific peptidase